VTIGAEQARAVVDQLGARWAIPMHYRTPRINFLETADAFLERFETVVRLGGPSFETAELPEGPVAVVPAAP
jgi:L-ascorbate metabolism protein UlaG (beta-lactamase superfamily)